MAFQKRVKSLRDSCGLAFSLRFGCIHSLAGHWLNVILALAIFPTIPDNRCLCSGVCIVEVHDIDSVKRKLETGKWSDRR
ncbi:hypothetical protein KQX54_002871 [Cotesia glomerata]|uniref:Uncharacterized protein n=1 Tax=Cotesia glomerata TaxID=32391 RepID=A0AAV7J4D5_COTGL|nr:hypothetical protein KQX54_002871 [Cotesia glomerata]